MEYKIAPENGIHAIAAVADAIGQIKQGRIDESTTVNVGTITGGLSKNIVPEVCTIEGEARSLNHDKAVHEVDKIHDIFMDVAKKTWC